METAILGSHPPLVILALGVLGLVIGSFLNVCIFRIPEGTFWQKARSICRSCGTLIPSYRNIPVFSFFLQRGRCASCHERISWQYPVVEALSAILFVAFYWKYPFLIGHDGHMEMDWGNFLRYSHGAIFCCFLIIATFVDLRLMIIPDVISLGLVVLSPLVVFLHPELRWQDSLFGVLLGGGLLYGIAWLYWMLKKQIGMGMGDVKFLAGIGGWLGWQSIGPVVLYAAISGSVIGLLVMAVRGRNMKMALPFGPYLALAALLFLWFGPEMLQWLQFGGSGQV